MIHTNLKSWIAYWLFQSTIFVSGVSAAQENSAIEFRRDIFPILSNTCFKCHGPDQQSREGGFRFDVKKSALGEADSGQRPIVPGDVDASELIRRISSTDEQRMPPEGEEKQLSETEISLLHRWIAGGAPWQEHWAFAAPIRPELPDVNNTQWPRKGLDYFVLQKLESNELFPKPAARKSTLIRRVALDLTGLPPTIDQLDQFLADDSPSGYEKMVDRYLASPHYGEQMASRWLDAARYADTNGYQNDFNRNMWPWRDWVINALNDNKPFDQFTIEQIAGDMLDNPSPDQKIATGFNRNHRTVTEGGSIEQEWHVENIVDRVETTSTVFLGLTMGCARCHDHKYDPISQREFYQFFAYFNNVDEKGFHNERRGNVPPMVKVPPADYEAKLAEFDQQIAKARLEIEDIQTSLDSKQLQWETELSGSSFTVPTDAKLAFPADANTTDVQQLGQLVDHLENEARLEAGLLGRSISFDRQRKTHVVVGDGFSFVGDQPFSVATWVRPGQEGAIISRMDADNAYRGFDTLVLADGRINVHLIHDWPRSAVKITTKTPLQFDHWTHVSVIYDGSMKAAGIKVFLNGRQVPHDVNNDNLTGDTTTDHPIWLGLRTHTPRFDGLICNVRLFDRQLTDEELQGLVMQPMKEIAEVSSSQRIGERAKLVQQIFRSTCENEFADANAKLGELMRQRQQYIDNIPTTMIMQERTEPRMTYVLNRGQYDQPLKDQAVEPGTPAFLPAAEGEQNRLALARWLVDPKNPLTARVAVNRIWEQFFGIGLVESSENFGVQAPLPSHGELLDWLALEFVSSGWNVKALQKLILMSATYRQSSEAPAHEYALDPTNRLLSRGPRFRLSAEAIRDNALAISGLLVNRIGGPSIKPYQPDKLWDELAGGAREGVYVQDKDENLYRRSLYIYRKRTVPHPTMTTFDAGSREICQVARSRTNTPLQALALLNDTTYVEAARSLATVAMRSSDSTELQVELAFWRATCRKPTAEEKKILVQSFERSLKRFLDDPASTKQFVEVGESSASEEFDEAPLAAMTVVASIILNLDETITKE